MEKKNTRRSRSTRAKKVQEEKPVQIEGLQECKPTDKSVREEKMAAQNVAAKEKTKSGGRGGKKAQSKTDIQPEAGPSGLGQSVDKPVVEQTDFMIICKYKTPTKINSKPTQPYEVRWGHNYLKTLLPNPNGRSIMKKPYNDGKRKQHLKFSQTTVYYFERSQLRGSRPGERDLEVGMERHHFYSSLLPVDTFEAEKNIRQRRNLHAALFGRNDVRKLVLPKNSNEKDIILHTIQVPVELIDEGDDGNIVQKVRKSCSCNLYCDPDICECNLNGKKCEVFTDDFPCGCLIEYCKNSNGREAYNTKYVKKNVVAVANPGNPAPEAKGVKKGRVNKRKQYAPLHYKRYY